MSDSYDEEALGGAARRWHKKIAFKKGLVLGVTAGMFAIGGISFGISNTYASQEEVVSVYENEMDADAYAMSGMRSSVLYQQFKDSPVMQSDNWQSYVTEQNAVTESWNHAFQDEGEKFRDSIPFPDLKSRMSKVVDFNEKMQDKGYGFGFNNPREEVKLFADINKACTMEITIADNQVPVFIDPEHGEVSMQSAGILRTDGTVLGPEEVTAKEAQVMKEGLIPAIEEGKRLFCPEP